MTKYLVLYNSPVTAEEVMASSTPEQAQAGMEAWMAWAKKAGDAVVDLGLPLGSSKKVGPDGVADGTSQARGFSILQGDSQEAVVSLLQDHPHLMQPGATIEVLETLAIPGM